MKPSKLALSKICVAAALSALIVGALAVGAPHIARAQPDPNNAPKAQNPDNRPARPINRREPVTPEERDKMMERYMRSQLERAAVTDQKQQDAALQYIQGEMDARDDLQESSNALTTALRNQTVTDSQFAGLLNTYLVAVEDDRARRVRAQKKLGETLEMTKFPRLEATLALMGLWDDAPNMGGRTFMGRGRNRDNRRNDNNAKPAVQPADKTAAQAAG